jgi:hypothetical protein
VKDQAVKKVFTIVSIEKREWEVNHLVGEEQMPCARTWTSGHYHIYVESGNLFHS